MPPSFWQANTTYVVGNRIVDNNGNIQQVTVPGTSGGTAPAWSQVLGGFTSDNGITWEYIGYETIQLAVKPIGPARQTPLDAVIVSRGSADAGKVVLLNPAGQLDPSMGGGGGGGGSFSGITSGTNDSATMTVGTGAEIVPSGSGVINATEINGIPILGTLTHAGQIPISQPGNTEAVWADPLVQGIQAEGTSASTVNPVLVAGKNGSGNLTDLPIVNAGSPAEPAVNVNVVNSLSLSGNVAVSNFPAIQPVSGTVTADQGGSWTVAATQSGPWSVTFPSAQAVTLASTTITGTVAVTQSTSPWVVSGTVTVAGTVAVSSVTGIVDVTVTNVPEFTISGVGTTCIGASASPSLTQLGTAGQYAVLAFSGVTNTGSSVVSGGNLGSFPTNSFTQGGLTFVLPAAYVTAVAQNQTDLASAIAYYQGLTVTQTLTTADMGTQSGGGAPVGTYYAGVYKSGSSLAIDTPITLDAQGNVNAIFVFLATASTITQQIAGTINLINGANPCNIIWVAGSSWTSIGPGAVTVGTILAVSSITLGGGLLTGRALANTGAVTIATAETITVPECAGSGACGLDVYLLNSCISVCGTTFTTYGSPAQESLNVYVVNFPSSFAVTQGTSPWIVRDAAAEASLASLASVVSSYGSPASPVLQVEVMNPVTVTQDTSPWVTSMDAVNSVISASNSSTTQLGIGGVFTGGSIDLVATGYTAVQVQLLTDQDGTLELQFSTNDVNWDHTVSTAFFANNSASLATGIHGRYARVVVMNTSGTAQTFLRLQTLLVPIPVQPTIIDLDSLVTVEDNAMVVRAVITGTSSPGVYTDVNATPIGSLEIAGSGVADPSVVTWDVSTPAGTTLNVLSGEFNYNTVGVSLVQSASITGGTINFEGSVDGINYVGVTGILAGTTTAMTSSMYTLVPNATVVFLFNVTGFGWFRLRLQPAISGSGSPPSGSVTISTAVQSLASPNIVSTISTGSITINTNSNQGSPNTLNNAWPIEVTDGIHVAAIKAASTPAVATDQALVVAISPNNTVAVTQSTSPWVVSGAVTVSGTVGVTQSTSPWIVQDTAAEASLAAIQSDLSGMTYTRAGSPAESAMNVYVVSGSSTVLQGTSPWVVSGTVTADIAAGQTIAVTNAGTFAVQATQSGSWNVGVTGTVAVSNLPSLSSINYGSPATEALNVYVVNQSSGGGGSVTQGTTPWVVSGTVAVTQSTSPWVVSGTVSGTVSTVPAVPTTGTTTRTNINTSATSVTVITGSGSETIRLWRLIVSVLGLTNIEIGDSSSPPNIFLGPYYLSTNGSVVLDISGEPWLVTGAGASLVLYNSNGAQLTITSWTTQS
jgi:hypothetical protein